MAPGKGIPFLDLVTPHAELEEELLDVVKGILRSAGFSGGPVVEQFEHEFAEFCGVDHCIGVSSGTDALRFALMAADVGDGDVVLTVPNTFVATIEAIIQAGATPQFVDIDDRTFNISVDRLRAYLETECDRSNMTGLTVHRASGRCVKAIMPVHLYGQMCDMDPIIALAEEYGLMVFEDACQAHGSEYFSKTNDNWIRAGSMVKAAAFSFYPGKNLGACGEAGAVTTNDEALAVRIRMIRDHGQNQKYHHTLEGYNGRLDAIQAGMLSVKLRFLAEWNSKRRLAAETYNQLLKEVHTLTLPSQPEWSRGNYHLYVVRTEQREELQRHLAASKIATGLQCATSTECHEAFECVTTQPMREGPSEPAYRRGLQTTFGGCGQKPWS